MSEDSLPKKDSGEPGDLVEVWQLHGHGIIIANYSLSDREKAVARLTEVINDRAKKKPRRSIKYSLTLETVESSELVST